MGIIIEAIDLCKTYKMGEISIEVLRGVNFAVNQGEYVSLMGPSGSGKSTLLYLLGGLDKPTSGSIKLKGRELALMKDKEESEMRRREIGFVFQFYNLVPNLTLKENIEVCAYLSKNPLEIDELLKTLGLYEHKDKLPSQLSGGQQQRCAIGRALVKNPSVLLCDEPTGALDYQTSKEILSLIEEINKKYSNTIIIVTHNDAIKNIANHVLRMRDGVIVSDYVNENPIPAGLLEW